MPSRYPGPTPDVAYIGKSAREHLCPLTSVLVGKGSSENKQLEKHLAVTAILKKIKQVTVMVGVVENREASLKRGELNEGRSSQVRVGGEPSRQRGD